jgi:hypothetical protein
MSSKAEAPQACLYDWESLHTLTCQVCKSKHTVVRMHLWVGHDLLLELFDRGMLVGEALANARKLRKGAA